MAKKTMKQIEAELEEAKAQLQGAQQSYDTLMEQAQGLQSLAANRLVYLRMTEAFVNEVNQSLQKLQRDIAEVNAQQAQAQEEEEGEG